MSAVRRHHARERGRYRGRRGRDIMIGSGGGIHAHPQGPRAGARALRQAIDAAVKGIKLELYAKDHEELGVALGVWSKKTDFKI